MGLGTKSATGTRSALGAKGATLGVSLVGRRGEKKPLFSKRTTV